MDKGRKLPDWAENEPYLEPAELWLLSAYFDLATCRTMDGFVPWTVMIEYAKHLGLEPDVADSFVRIMRIVDNDKLRRNRAQRENQGVESSPRAESALAMTAGSGVKTASKEAMMASAQRRASAAAGKKK